MLSNSSCYMILTYQYHHHHHRPAPAPPPFVHAWLCCRCVCVSCVFVCLCTCVSRSTRCDLQSDVSWLHWTAFIIGPPDTAYSGHRFELEIRAGSDYPLSPPKVMFRTKVCHPNVKFKTGEICLDVLKEAWTPVWGLESTCRAIISLLSNPEADSPLNCDAGNLVRCGDMRGYYCLARMYTEEYATRL
jgi:peroxin-4